MKDLGPVKQFLGINIESDSDKIFLHQTNFAKSLLEKFGFENCKPIATPSDVSSKQSSPDEEKFDDIEKYQSAVGALLYMSTRTRPDLSYAVNNVAKFCSQPCKSHWIAVKRIFRYIQGTLNFGILYEKSKVDSCFGFSDADWAGTQVIENQRPDTVLC